MIHFGMTPSRETEGPDLCLTVKSLAVRIWTGRPLHFSIKSRNKDHSSELEGKVAI